MTGYGRGQAVLGDGKVVVEVRSVNHRYFELGAKLPRGLHHLEPGLRRELQSRFPRGRLDMLVTVEGPPPMTTRPVVNLEVAKEYTHQLRALKRALGLAGDPDLALLAGFREIFTLEERADGARFEGPFRSALSRAAAALEAMRSAEGRALAKELVQGLRVFSRTLGQLERRAPKRAREVERRVKRRVQRLLGRQADQARFIQEAASAIERGDTTEELQRLRSHLAQFQALLKTGGVIGKSLEFLLQEMHREVTTVGAKADDPLASHAVVLLKTEVEKLREQVHNIE